MVSFLFSQIPTMYTNLNILGVLIFYFFFTFGIFPLFHNATLIYFFHFLVYLFSFCVFAKHASTDIHVFTVLTTQHNTAQHNTTQHNNTKTNVWANCNKRKLMLRLLMLLFSPLSRGITDSLFSLLPVGNVGGFG